MNSNKLINISFFISSDFLTYPFELLQLLEVRNLSFVSDERIRMKRHLPFLIIGIVAFLTIVSERCFITASEFLTFGEDEYH